KGSEQFRSHLGVPLVAEQFYSIHSVVNQTLFGGYQVFKVDATSGTPLECAEAQQALLNAQLKNCGYKGVSAKSEFREITYDGLFYGFGVAHYGWMIRKEKRTQKVYNEKDLTVSIDGNKLRIPKDEDNFKEVTIGEYEVNQPLLEHVPIR